MDTSELNKFFKRKQDQIAIRQCHGLGRIAFGVDAIDAEQIAFHWETQYLLVAEFIDQYGLEETGVNNKQGVERLADGVNTLASLELNVLEKKFFIVDRWCDGDPQKFAKFFEVGPQLALSLPADFASGRVNAVALFWAGLGNMCGCHGHLLELRTGTDEGCIRGILR